MTLLTCLQFTLSNRFTGHRRITTPSLSCVRHRISNQKLNEIACIGYAVYECNLRLVSICLKTVNNYVCSRNFGSLCRKDDSRTADIVIANVISPRIVTLHCPRREEEEENEQGKQSGDNKDVVYCKQKFTVLRLTFCSPGF